MPELHKAAELAETVQAGMMQDMPVHPMLWCCYMQAATAQVVHCMAEMGTVIPAARAMHPEDFHCNLLSPSNKPAAELVGCLTLGVRQHPLIEILVVNPLQAAGSASGCPLSRGSNAKAGLKHMLLGSTPW